MAEGHTIHSVADRLLQLADAEVASTSPDTRFPQAALFDSGFLVDAQAHGKHLIVEFAGRGDSVVHIHLGMAGRLSVRRHRRAIGADGRPRTPPPMQRRLRWRLLTPVFTADLSAPTVCEVLNPNGLRALRSRLGPDPLRPQDDPMRAFHRISRSRREIGGLITDQSVIAGIGNVYRSELLFRARLDPFRPGHEISEPDFWILWNDCVVLMTLGVEAGWIITHPAQIVDASVLLERDQKVPRWPKLYHVYGRGGRPCRVCGTAVSSQRLGQQRIFWCPECQRG